MNKIITLLSLVILMACQSNNKQHIEITFQIDMSEIIADIDDPSTIGIVGSGPLNWEITPLKDNGNGIYAITFEWPIKDTLEMDYQQNTQ